MRRGWESWGCSAWRREGSRETLEQLPVPEEAYRKDGEDIFSRICCNKTRSNGFKLRESTFRLDIRKKISMTRVVKRWHRLPREAVETPFLETFKSRLDAALSNLVEDVPAHCRGGWARWPLKVPSNPKHSVIL